MKPRPKPKLLKELIITKHPGRNIMLTYYSKDVKVFITTEAPNYGFVIKVDNSYYLDVRIEYDLDEVIEYFESYND